MEKAREIVDLDGAGKKLAAHGAQFGNLVNSYVASVNTCFSHMGVSNLLLIWALCYVVLIGFYAYVNYVINNT